MNIHRRGGVAGHRARAIIAVQVLVFLVVMLGFAALTVDVGVMYNTRADLQRAADAAALAGASAYTTDAMMRIRQDVGGQDTLAYVTGLVATRASQFSNINATFGSAGTYLAPSDIATGWMNLNSASDVIHTNPQPIEYNAVQVVVRKQSGGGEDSNGPIEFLFAPIFGRQTGAVTASAVAAFDDRYAGINVSGNGSGLVPFTIHEDAFNSELANGMDQYAFDDDSGVVTQTSDGIREIRLYPYPLSGSDWEEGDGNFGVLNIGTGNQGLQALREQITSGVTDTDFEMEVGTSDLTFFDDSGNPVTYDITGSPGLDVGLRDAIESRIGDVVGFFLHNDVVLSGSNAIYTIVEIRFGRVMDLRLTGAPSQRGFYIQPASYAGSDVIIDPDAPSSGGLVGRLVLVR